VGRGVGPLVGESVGAVGAGVGRWVGLLVGRGVGLLVGRGVGLLVGRGVGLLVGESVGAVGAGVGIGVGIGDGLAVGAGVAMSVKQRTLPSTPPEFLQLLRLIPWCMSLALYVLRYAHVLLKIRQGYAVFPESYLPPFLVTKNSGHSPPVQGYA